MTFSLSDDSDAPIPSPPRATKKGGGASSSGARRGASAPKPKAVAAVAAPKSAKTVQQTARARQPLDDDSDGDPSDNKMVQDTVRQMIKNLRASASEKDAKQSERDRLQYEGHVEETVGGLSKELAAQLADHTKQCAKVEKMAADSLKKIQAAENHLQQRNKDLEDAIAALRRKTKKGFAAVTGVALPASKAAVAAADKEVAKIGLISKKHGQTHEALRKTTIDWSAVARDFARVGEQHTKPLLATLGDLAKADLSVAA